MREVQPDKLPTEQTVDRSMAELNNNNNNQKASHCKLSVSSSISSVESIGSVYSEKDWVSVGTYRRRRISKEKTVSLKQGDEAIGLENVIPRHRSLKALGEMG